GLPLASFRQPCFQQPAHLGELFRQLAADSWVGCDVPLGLPMGFLMARCAEGDHILGRVITQSASRLNVMDLKTLDAPASSRSKNAARAFSKQRPKHSDARDSVSLQPSRYR